MKKKGLAWLLIGVMVCSLVACGEEQKLSGEPTLTVGATSTPEVTPTEVPKYEGVTFVIPDVTIAQKEIPNTEALNFVKALQVGWNLGNTFDSSNEEGVAESDEEHLKYETLWGNPVTTKELIQAVKDAGFQTIRIPVSWHNHAIGDDYQINEAWMKRVREVVDYAIELDMYVILNCHHDNTKVGGYYPNTEYKESSIAYLTAIWKQISENFKNYDEHLIFETLNEPRMVGTNYEWWIESNNASCKDAVACINAYNQAIVDVIRASGGNNTNRYVMVPGYCASADGALNSGFELPADSAENRLIISVHAYTPYSFALAAPEDSGKGETFDHTSVSYTKEIDTFMDKLYEKYVKNGIPVVIGEWGSRNKHNNAQERVNHAGYYIAAASARGMVCCWWDNNGFNGSGENFGLFARISRSLIFPDIVTAMLKYTMK